MSVFEIAAKWTMDAEGGYGNSSSDLGGETNIGISKRSYPHLDIKNLTRETALPIYKSDFWDKYQIGEIHDQSLANQIFDMVFNMNYTKAVYCIQRAIKTTMGIDVDGVMGGETLRALNILEPKAILNAVRVERMRHYLKRITENRTQLVNMPSWTRRALNEY
jgi:lysozyme family protein